MSLGTLTLMAILPAPLYAESHLHTFWPHFFALLCLMIAWTRGWLRIALAAGGARLYFGRRPAEAPVDAGLVEAAGEGIRGILVRRSYSRFEAGRR
jgi:hypothetical protein